MLKSRRFFLVLLPLIALGFAYGIVELLTLRFETGDVYPEYSSLRTDPLGCKALYESMARLRGFDATRLEGSLDKVDGGRDRVLFILGTPQGELATMEPDEYKQFERFFYTGGRVVIALYPQARRTFWDRRTDLKKAERDAERRQAKKNGNTNSPSRLEEVKLSEKWGVKTAFGDLDADEHGLPKTTFAERDIDESGLPGAFTLHTAVCFTNLDSHWRIIYKRGDSPVVVERPLGKGSLVLCADSWLFSNEAMRDERLTGFIAWCAGSARQAIFDETHLGVREEPGIASLMRKYRLHGLALALLVVAGLFVWQNASSLVPAEENELGGGTGNMVIGKDSAAGFVNLLRRNIPQTEVVNVCVAEWKKTAVRRDEARLRRIDAIVSEEKKRPVMERNPARAYQAIAAILIDKK